MLKRTRFLYIVMAFLCAVFWLVLVFGAAYKIIEKNYIYPLRYENEIVFAADKYGMDAALLFAVVKTESGFNAGAVSKKGAVGLMQILPSTAQFIAQKKGISEYDLKEVSINLDFGAYYWTYLWNKFGDFTETAAAYNAGEGTVKNWLKNAAYSADGKRLKVVPYSETAAYVKKISESKKRYTKLYGKLLDK